MILRHAKVNKFLQMMITSCTICITFPVLMSIISQYCIQLVQCDDADYFLPLPYDKIDVASPTTNPPSTMMKPIKTRPIILRPTEKHTGTIIFLHDYDQGGDWWIKELEDFQESFVKVILPTANTIEISKHSYKELPAWFDVIGETKYPIANENCSGINVSTAYVHDLIRKEMNAGIPPGRILLGGISQGATLALHAALTFKSKLAGVFLMSVWEPMNRTFIDITPNRIHEKMPIYIGHMSNDLVIAKDAGPKTAKLLERFKPRLFCKMYTAHKHDIDLRLLDVQAFCRKFLPRI